MTHARSARAPAAALAVLALALIVVRVQVGTAEQYDLSLDTALRAIGASLGVAEPLEDLTQLVAKGRLIDGTVALLVGASLALSGALLQGLFRNELASPGLIGVTAGAALGAALAIVAIAGAGAAAMWSDGGEALQVAARNAPLILTGAAFAGSLVVALFVTALSSRGGRISVPTLLLVGVAINACLGGVLAAVQDVLLREHWELAQSLFNWLFGSLQERTTDQLAIAAAGLAFGTAAIPFVARELDLFAGGEDAAASLGVSTARTKAIVLVAACTAAAAAVSVAGQIAFVGLVVPHLVRLAFGARHTALLPLSLLGGGVFLLGAEVLNIGLLGDRALKPGIVLSLVGGPFFLALLLRRRNRVATW